MKAVLDLEQLRVDHAELPAVRADELAECAALALEARGHEPGVALALDCLGRPETTRLAWTPRGPTQTRMRDVHRTTEDGADGITLAVLGAKRWRLLRRLQRGTFADWLVVDESDTERALEVSGTADGELGAVLRRKREQLDKSPYPTRSLCVVRFADPRLVLEHRP